MGIVNLEKQIFIASRLFKNFYTKVLIIYNMITNIYFIFFVYSIVLPLIYNCHIEII